MSTMFDSCLKPQKIWWQKGENVSDLHFLLFPKPSSVWSLEHRTVLYSV